MGKSRTKPRKIDPNNMVHVGPYLMWLLTNLVIIDIPRPSFPQLYMAAAYLATNYTMVEMARVVVLRVSPGDICIAMVTKKGTLTEEVTISPDCTINEGVPFQWDEQLNIADNLTNIRLDATKGLARLWR